MRVRPYQLLVKGKRKRRDDVDLTPMVDVTFLLLIFFMVTASFSMQKSIAMPRQQADLPSPRPLAADQDHDWVTVEIDHRGSFLVIAPTWQLETPSKQRLMDALRTAHREQAESNQLKLEVHREASLRHLVDALDAGTIAGFEHLAVHQQDEF